MYPVPVHRSQQKLPYGAPRSILPHPVPVHPQPRPVHPQPRPVHPQPRQQRHYDPGTSQPILPVTVPVASQQRQVHEVSQPTLPIHVPVSLQSRQQLYGVGTAPVSSPRIVHDAVQDRENKNLPSPGFPSTAIPRMIPAPPLHLSGPNVTSPVFLPSSQSSLVQQFPKPMSPPYQGPLLPTPQAYQGERPFQMPNYPMQHAAWPLQPPSLYSVPGMVAAQVPPMRGSVRLPPGTVSQQSGFVLPYNEQM